MPNVSLDHQIQTLLLPLSALTEAQVPIARKVASFLGRCAAEMEPRLYCGDPALVPGVDEQDYLREVVYRAQERGFAVATDVQAWEATLGSGQAKQDPRVEAFVQGYNEVVERVQSRIVDRTRVLSDFLKVRSETISLGAVGPYDQVVLCHEDEMYMVFAPGEDYTVSHAFVRDNPHRFLCHTELLMRHTLLPMGAESMVRCLTHESPEEAREALLSALVDPDAFADEVLGLQSDWLEFMSAGLAGDAVEYPLENNYRILRILEMEAETMGEAEDFLNGF